MQLEKVYEPQRFEPHWAQWWIDNGVFNVTEQGEVFSLVIPPPNVTGSLHMGHMLEHTEIDATIRWRRMSGYATLWLPGTDHAGIATQMVVERELAKGGVSRFDLGREKFIEEVWRWKAQYHARITKQTEALGARSTGRASGSRWMKGSRARCARSSCGSTTRASSTAMTASSTGRPGCQTVISDLEVVRARRAPRAPVAHRLSGRRQRPPADRRHDPARDHARRHRRRGPPRRRALLCDLVGQRSSCR
jgi:valyl-tRNA synthetase